MLVEYGFETKDEDMVPMAIELRRRMAARKLKSAVDANAIGEIGLKRLVKLNTDELDTHMHENFSVSMAGVKGKITVSRAEQQLNLEASVKTLGRDIDRASKLSKSRIDILGDLESRITKMRHQLKDPTQKTVEQELGDILRSNAGAKNESQFEVCLHCQKRILVKLYANHIVQCQRKENTRDAKHAHETRAPVFDLDTNQVVALTTFLPSPPRNCKVVEMGSTFIRWEWAEPITDGGLPIYEYEVRYTEKFMEMNKKTKRYTTIITEKESHLTSMWCTLNPICHTGAKIVGLTGNTEYNSWRIRCRTLRGWSEWSDMLHDPDDSHKKQWVLTDDVEPPSPPLFFRKVQITASCIHLAWDLPFNTGGSMLVDFVVFYTACEIRTTTTERDVVYEVKSKHYTDGVATSCVLRNLPADTVIKHIMVKAINKKGLISDPMKLPKERDEDGKEEDDVKTNIASKHALVHREFDRAQNSKETYMDTSFFTGVQQRLLRIDFMQALEQEMKHLKPDPLEIQEAKEWMAACEMIERKKRDVIDEAKRSDPFADDGGGNDDEGDVLAKGEEYIFSNQQRRQHFKRKIASLEKDIIDLGKAKYEVDAERSRLTNVMKTEQTSKMSFKLERDRVKNYNGTIVTSAVLQGAPMQYVHGDFMKKVEAAAEECETTISESKFKVMAGEIVKANLKRKLGNAEAELKNRRALFLNFDMKHKQHMKAMHKLTNADGDDRAKRKYFNIINDHARERIRVRKLIIRLFNGRVVWQKRNAFIKWARPEELSDMHVDTKPTNEPISQGGLMLVGAMESRLELQASLRTAIAGTTNIRQSVALAGMATDNRKMITKSKDYKGMEEGMDHIRFEENGMHFLYEGDGYASEGKFILAYASYDAQVIFLRSKPKLDIKLLSITHGRLGKMFLLQGKFDRAIVEFDRQLSLAREIDDKPEQADSYFGMGQGYLELRDYDNAIRYLGIAQTRLSSMGNMPKYCGCMRALREVYERLGQQEPVEMYDEKIFKVEGELRYKLNMIGTKLHDLTQRLNNTNAEIENMVNLERTSLKAISLKVQINDLHDELETIEADEEKQEDAVNKLKDLLAEVQRETDMAYASDEGDMLTNTIYPTPVVMEIEELKNRLDAKKKEEVKNLEVADLELTRLQGRVKNFEDTIHDLDIALDLENGPLMKKSRHDQAFRCVSFCTANAAGDEVTGTSTGGAENFIAAEGNNIHVLDYHSGELLHVFAGEPKGSSRAGASKETQGHGGVVTTLVHDCSSIFSGSTDETIRKWNIATHEQELIFRGHEGSITALAVDSKFMMSGSSDATMRLWNKFEGTQLRVVFGHHKSILSIEMGGSWMLSGSADEEVRVWSIKEKSKHTTTVDCTNRLIGHETSVTCVKYSKLEILSADIKGRIFIWWMKTGEVIRKIQAHESAIRCIQFDAVHIVSGGVDSCVDIIDIATGEVVQKLRGHEGAVMSVAFDSNRIVSAGGDNTLRFWQWGKKSSPQDKFHVLDSGQSLITVSKMYPGVSVDELMKWNGIIEARQIYAGMKLIVKKADPDQPSDAEAAAAERQRRREQGNAKQQKRISEKGLLKATMASYDRVYRNATDFDYHSLGNRMFKQAKSDHELFPDHIDLDANPYALSQRLKKDAETAGKLEVPKPKGRYFMNKENEEEWGEVSDAVCVAMMELFVEYDAYDLVLEAKSSLRSTKSVIGRIHAYEAQVESAGTREQAATAAHHTKEKRFLMPEERKALRKAKRKEEKKQDKRDARERERANALLDLEQDAALAQDGDSDMLLPPISSSKLAGLELDGVSAEQSNNEKSVSAKKSTKGLGDGDEFPQLPPL